MTREQLVNLIYECGENWTCPSDGNCDLPQKEGHTGECCKKCAEKLLKEYEKGVINQHQTRKRKKISEAER